MAALADDPVTTTRDAQGIWFIEGGSLYDVYEAMGYAMATDRLFQMDTFRRSARGSMSELFGAEFLGQDFLTADITARLVMYSDDELTDMFNALSDDARTVVQAYVDGVNRRIFEIYGDWLLMPFEYWIGSFFSAFVEGLPYNMLPTPWTTNDVLGWLAALQRNFDGEAFEQGQLENAVLAPTLGAVFGAEGLAMFQDLRWINDPAAQTMIPIPAGAKSARAPELPKVDTDALPDLRGAAERIRSRFEQRDEAIESIGATAKMGSYAWAISGDKTASGNPMVYSGPQMGFLLPSIVLEGSIRGGGIEISGMTVPGIPGFIIGRTPHHAWSLQNGAAHTQDWFIEAPQSVFLHHVETIHPAGGDPVLIPIYRSHHGPIIDPFPFNPDDPPPFAVSWAYASWGHEGDIVESMLDFARAESMAEFGTGVAKGVASQHFTYADRDGNIAYWMSGWDPIRAPGVDPRFPQIGNGFQEWTGELRPQVHDENTAQGYYGGWNNKASIDYNNAFNNYSYYLGPAHRAQVIEDYLSTHDNLTYEEVRDLALNVATTDSIRDGGNTWPFVADDFKAAVAANSSVERDEAIAMLDAWDGHFVAGGPAEWRFGTLRADAWVLQDAWIGEVLRITFEDEFRAAGMSWEDQPESLLFNVLLRALAGQTYYDWFQDKAGTGDKPTGAEAIILRALDNVIEHAGLGPYNEPRGTIDYTHDLLANLDPAFEAFHSTPFSSRSTYAHVVEFDETGPIRIESMFPLGESGQLWFDGTTTPIFDPNYLTMIPPYDSFMPRSFPLFD
jgi:penicillin amidase